MMDQRWLLDRLLEAGENDAKLQQQIIHLRESFEQHCEDEKTDEREQNSRARSFWANVIQAVIATAAITALMVSIFKH